MGCEVGSLGVASAAGAADSRMASGRATARALAQTAPLLDECTVGRVLGIPQILIGIILIAWGVAYPAVFGIRGVLAPALYTVIFALMFLAGIKYLHDGLRLLGYPNSPGTSGE